MDITKCSVVYQLLKKKKGKKENIHGNYTLNMMT